MSKGGLDGHTASYSGLAPSSRKCWTNHVASHAAGHLEVGPALGVGVVAREQDQPLGLRRPLARRTDEARAELSTAVAMLREMSMTFWLPEAAEELTAAGGTVFPQAE